MFIQAYQTAFEKAMYSHLLDAFNMEDIEEMEFILNAYKDDTLITMAVQDAGKQVKRIYDQITDIALQEN